MVTGAVSLGVKKPGREFDHVPPSSAKSYEWVELYLHLLTRLNGLQRNTYTGMLLCEREAL